MSSPSRDPDLRFRARPFVCGAVGDWAAPLLKRLIESAPTELKTVVEGDRVKLCSSSRLPSWRTGERHGHHWGALADGPSPRDWREASESRMAVGVEIGEGHIALHADAMGMQDLYYRRIGNAVYFAGRMEPLLGVDDTRLHVNWDAWASVLAFTAPLGDDTPFTEIRRLRAASAWIWHDGRLRLASFEPSWMAEEPDPGFRAAEAVATMAQVIRPSRRTGIALSGGWDSRLLGALATRRNRRMRAWTTSPDGDLHRDVVYAGPVAKALGMRQRVLIPDDRARAAEHAAVRHRTAFQTTLHTWLMPLARELHRHGAPLLDGLAGDVLFKALLVPETLLTERDSGRRRLLMWEELGGKRLLSNDLLRPEALDACVARSQSTFATAVAGLAEHPAAATLATLHTRTARSIAASPLWLMGPEIAVELPFLHPEVIKAAVRVPLQAKVGGGYYRQMLTAADPRIATLPSTNDPLPEDPSRAPRHQAGSASVKAVVDDIRSSAFVLDLFTPKARARLLNPELPDPSRGKISHLRTLHWASLLGHWLERYRSHLVVDDFPGMRS